MATKNTVSPIGQGFDQDPMAILSQMIGNQPMGQPAQKPASKQTGAKKEDASAQQPSLVSSSAEETMQNTMKAGYSQLLLQGILKGTDPQTIATHAKEAANAINSLVSVAPTQDLGQIQINKPVSEMPQEQATAPIGEQKQGGKYQVKPASSPFGFGGATMDEQGNVIEQKPGFVGNLLMALVGNPKGETRRDLQNLAEVQKLSGTEPVQPTTRYQEKMKLKGKELDTAAELGKLEAGKVIKDEEHAQKILDAIAEPAKISGDALSMKATSEEIQDNATKLLARLKEDPGALRTLALPNDPRGQETMLWARSIKTRSKFMTGGKALTDIENKLLDQLSTREGLASYLQNPETSKKIVEGIQKKAKAIVKEIDPYIEERELVNKARATGKYTEAQILAMITKRRARDNDSE